jgi:hypothetical protein
MPAGKAWQDRLAGMNNPVPAAGTADHQAILDALVADKTADAALLSAISAASTKIDVVSGLVSKVAGSAVVNLK